MKKQILKIIYNIGYFMYRFGPKIPMVGKIVNTLGLNIFCWVQKDQLSLFVSLSNIIGNKCNEKNRIGLGSKECLTKEQQIWELYNEGFDRKEIAKIFGVCVSKVYDIGKRRIKPPDTETVVIPQIKKGGCEVQDGCFRRIDCLDNKGE